MKLKSVNSLASFININSTVATCPFTEIETVIKTLKGVVMFFKSTTSEEEINRYIDKYVEILKDTKFERETWEFYLNVYSFKGEIEYYCKTMPFRRALEVVREEYDF